MRKNYVFSKKIKYQIDDQHTEDEVKEEFQISLHEVTHQDHVHDFEKFERKS